ncbi:MAG: peptide ABC transporter substrate-binding protein, partial [Sedimenticolaceae bacterium]
MARKLTQWLPLFKVLHSRTRHLQVLLPVLLALVLAACTDRAWNDPYQAGESAKPIFFSSFSERPKHLDPARSYSANEWAFISQIYEPPLQYHFLHRPYDLVPLTTEVLPEILYYGYDGSLLNEEAPAADVAYTDYVLRIR